MNALLILLSLFMAEHSILVPRQITLQGYTDYTPIIIWNVASIPEEKIIDTTPKVGDTCPTCKGTGTYVSGDGIHRKPCDSCGADGILDPGDPLVTGVPSLAKEDHEHEHEQEELPPIEASEPEAPELQDKPQAGKETEEVPVDWNEKIPPLSSSLPEKPTRLPGHITYKSVTQTGYREVRVKHCNGRLCWYTTELRPYTYTVRVPTESTYSVPRSEADEYATPRNVVDRILAYLRIKPNEIFIDIGSGDGRICIEASKRYGCKSIGIELDPKRINLARANAEQAGVSHLVTFIEGDFTKVAWPYADVGYVYLFPEDLAKIKTNLLALDRFASFAHAVPDLNMHHPQDDFYVWDYDRVFTLWGGVPKYGRQCTRYNCSMCNTIESQIQQQKYYRKLALSMR